MPAGGQIPIIGCAMAVAFSQSGCTDDFATDRRQLQILHSYYPDVHCSEANFRVVEREESVQDWRYVTRISGSEPCLKSLRDSLVRRGFVDRSSGVGSGLQPPAQSTENEAVVFDFDREAGAVYWTRDKT